MCRYKCEVEKCSNRTEDYLCKECFNKLKRGYDYVACINCGVIIEIKKSRTGKVEYEEWCWVCKKKKSKIWKLLNLFRE